MGGKCHSRSMEPFTDSLQKLINGMDCSQLIHRTIADVSQIRGVYLPKPPDECIGQISATFVQLEVEKYHY